MPYITWFDPGMSTGIVRGWFSETEHYEPDCIWQIGDGTRGLRAWLDTHPLPLGLIVGAEKFVPRTKPGMTHTLESTYPLVQEGVLIDREIMPEYPGGNWQMADAQLLLGGKDAEERKRRSDDLLKARGLWLTDTDVGQKDANDAISATKHILHFLTRTLRHEPTRAWLYGEEN